MGSSLIDAGVQQGRPIGEVAFQQADLSVGLLTVIDGASQRLGGFIRLLVAGERLQVPADVLAGGAHAGEFTVEAVVVVEVLQVGAGKRVPWAR